MRNQLPVPSFTNSVTNGGVTSTGTATQTYVFGAVADTGTYFTRTSVLPRPPLPAVLVPGNPNEAWAKAEDPIDFTANSSTPSDFKFDASLTSLKLDASQGMTGFAADFTLDGKNLLSMSIIAPADFTSSSQVRESFSSILGPSYDKPSLANLNKALTIDPLTETITLNTGNVPLTPLPITGIPIGAGDHEFAGGSGTFVIAGGAVPEPASLVLAAMGGIFLLAYAAWARWRRGIPRRPAGSCRGVSTGCP